MAKAAMTSQLTVGSLVAEVTSISGPNVSADMIDVTYMKTSSNWKEFVVGLRDGGELTFDCNMTTANATALFALLGAAFSTCILTFGGSSGHMDFSAGVSAISFNAPVADKLSLSVTLKLSGTVTYDDDIA